MKSVCRKGFKYERALIECRRWENMADEGAEMYIHSKGGSYISQMIFLL